MINLGRYSGKKAPNVRFHPVLVDRLLEGAAFLLVLILWGCIYWFYALKEVVFTPNAWIIGGFSLVSFMILGICSYLPVRFVNFPVPVNERNIGIQYLLAIRLTRVMNVILNLMFLSGMLMEYSQLSSVFFGISFLLLILAFIGYYILAYRYR